RRATPRSIAAYLVAAAMFMLVLSFFLHAEVIDFLSQLSQPGMSASRVFISNCSVSWPLRDHCVGGAGLADPPTLAFLDVAQAVVLLIFAVLFLALAGTVESLGFAGERAQQPVHAPGSSASKASGRRLTGEFVKRFVLAFSRLLWPVLIVV